MSNINLGNTISRVGLVGEWLLDGNRLDTSGNGYNGTATNVTWSKTTKGYQAQAGSFNGSSSVITVPARASLEFGTGDFSISFGLYANSLTLYANTIGKYSSSNNGGWTCQLGGTSSDRGNVYMREAGTLNETIFETTTGYYETGKNNYYTLVIKASNAVDFYKNGKLFQTVTGTRRNISNSSAQLTIGRNYTTSYVNGNEQNIRLHNYALSEYEIQILYKERNRKLGPSNIRAYPKLLDGLVGYWDFRGTAHNLVDGVAGTVTGATLTTDRFGNSNSAYSFSGTSQYINLPTEITNALTIAWRGTIVDNSYTNGMLFTRTGSYNYIGQMFGNNFYMDLGGGNVLLTTGLTSADNNVYHDWILTKTPGTNTYVLYKDGIQVGSGTSTLTLNFGGIAYRRFGNDYFYKGTLDYVLALNKGLTADEVKALYQLTSSDYIYPAPSYDIASLRDGLVLDLNEQGKDLSGNGNNGTLVNSPAVVRQGKAKGLSYNGSNQCQNITNNGFGITSDYTLSAWIKCTTLNSEANILSKDGPVGGRDWQFRGNSNGTLSFFRGDSSNGTLSDITTSGYTINDGKYHLVVARFSSSGGSQILIDGIVRATSGVLTSKNISSSNCQIGARGDSLYFFTGNIISPRIRNRALSAKEIQALYFSSKGNYIY